MTAREWIDNLDDTDRKGMAMWGIVLGIAVLGSLVPAIGWVFCLLIGLFWFLFIWGIVLYGWLGWLIPERTQPERPLDAYVREVLKPAGPTYATFSEIHDAVADGIRVDREQQLARPVPVPDLDKVNSLHRPETHR